VQEPSSRDARSRRTFLGGAAAGLLGTGLGAALPTTPAEAATSARLAGAAPAQGRYRNRRVRFGLNYTPSKNWWYSWADWDTDSIRRDLANIASIGMDHIRIMALWPDLQPNAAYVRAEMTQRLVEMLDLAGEADLDVEVTVFNGQVSGFLFTTPWLINGGNGKVTNLFTDTAAIASEQQLLAALSAAAAKHPRFLGFDLSNEIYWFTKPFGIDIPPATGDAWLTTMFAAAEKYAPGRLHVVGNDHWPWMNNDYFSRDGLGQLGSASANHTWAGWTEVPQTYGPMSTESVHYSEYFIELIKAFHTDLSRQVWIEETGMSTKWMDASLIPSWTEDSIRNMVSCAGLWGITWWCSHEVSTRFTGFNPLEYDLGVFTNERVLKPIGATIQRLAAEFDKTPPQPLARPEALVLPDDMVPWNGFFEPYMTLIKQGVRPAVVKQSRSTDAAYLHARGIGKLIYLNEVS
jgi:hypothetical protein